jgi:hypothetical protein
MERGEAISLSRIKRFGIATTVVPRGNQPEYRPSFGFRKMAAYAESLGLHTILFHPEDFSPSTGEIHGWVARGNRWYPVVQPFPDVVYENIFVHLVVKGAAHTLRFYARNHRRPVLNAVLPGKYGAYRQMCGVPELARFLPETRWCRSPVALFRMLGEHPAVYLKPTGGYGGRGVVRITRTEPGWYLLESDRDRNGRWKEKVSAGRLETFLRHRIQQCGHIIQPALPLVRIDGGQVDFRVVWQRDRYGDWQLVGIVPRVSRRGGVVTNLAAGGKAMSLEAVQLQKPFCDMPQSIQVLLEEPTRAISKFWSYRYRTFGIAGYDMGIDENGNVWFIELNPKPARTLLTPRMLDRSYRYVAEFAAFLAYKVHEAGRRSGKKSPFPQPGNGVDSGRNQEPGGPQENALV